MIGTIHQRRARKLVLEGEQTIPLPVLTADPSLLATVPQGDPATRLRKRKVLVVDDEEPIADSLKLIFDQWGCESRAAYSGEMAIAMLSEFEPEIVVSDVIMPGISGIQTALTILAAVPNCTVLLISGNEASATLLEAARLQNHQFEILAKPFHPSDLLIRLSIAKPD